MPYRPVHRTIYDDAWGLFRQMLTYKMEDRGKHLLTTDWSFPSSQMCHCCGHINTTLDLATRKWTCPICHTQHHRDKNAAYNLKKEGERLLKEFLLAA